MGLQAIMNALHRKDSLRVDIEASQDFLQLNIFKENNYIDNFEIYPPLGIILITSDIIASRRIAEATFQALPRNPYARDLKKCLEFCIESDQERTIIFSKYSPDTRTLCRFIKRYFSFVEPNNEIDLD